MSSGLFCPDATQSPFTPAPLSLSGCAHRKGCIAWVPRPDQHPRRPMARATETPPTREPMRWGLVSRQDSGAARKGRGRCSHQSTAATRGILNPGNVAVDRTGKGKGGRGKGKETGTGVLVLGSAKAWSSSTLLQGPESRESSSGQSRHGCAPA